MNPANPFGSKSAKRVFDFMQNTNPANGFSNVLGQIRNGALVDELTESLTEAVIAMRKTGKKSSLILKMDLVPVTKGDTSSLYIDADVTVKLPKPEQRASVFFTNEENELLRNDPRQKEFEQLKVVDGKKKDEPLKTLQNAVNQ